MTEQNSKMTQSVIARSAATKHSQDCHVLTSFEFAMTSRFCILQCNFDILFLMFEFIGGLSGEDEDL